MLPCHVILCYSVCQTKLHANVHFFHFFFRCGPCGVYMRLLSLWLSETEKTEIFLSYIFLFVFFFSLWNQSLHWAMAFHYPYSTPTFCSLWYFLPLYFYPDISVPHFFFPSRNLVAQARKKGLPWTLLPLFSGMPSIPRCFLFVLALFAPFSGFINVILVLGFVLVMLWDPDGFWHVVVLWFACYVTKHISFFHLYIF